MKKKKLNLPTDLAKQIEKMVETDSRDPHAFAIILEGDSMAPAFVAGDVVVFTPKAKLEPGDFAIVKLKDNRVMFKRWQPDGDKVRLLSVNENYGPLEFRLEEVLFAYRAYEVKRKL